MLKYLFIQNYILIDKIRIEFGDGLNIITGETGAGKSILVDALGAVLGETLSRDSIRQGAQKAIFEAQFDLKDNNFIHTVLQQNDLDDYETTLIVRRELNRNGRSRAFVNDSPVSMAVLSEIGDLLVDLHGQHEHQLLLKPAKHIDYLDDYSGLTQTVSEIKQHYQEFKEIHKQLEELKEKQDRTNEARDLLRFQLNEIAAINPQEDEDQQLKQEELIHRNAELLFEKTTALYDQLYEKEGAVVEVLKWAEQALEELAQIDVGFSQMHKECENAGVIVNDIAAWLGKYNQSIDFDSQRLEDIRQRLIVLRGLAKKFGGSLDSVFEHQRKIREELTALQNVKERIDELENQLDEKRCRLADLCLHVSKERQTHATALGDQVTQKLSRLGMEKAQFKVVNQIKTTESYTFITHEGKNIDVGPKGIDRIEFQIRTNPGEPFKPLVNIASGGEISRVMLAFKSLLAESDKVPVLIFDEIDSGVSGRIAQAVGATLRTLSKSHQLICVTHLPQIASMAHHHFLVRKTFDKEHTQTELLKLYDEERREQIARLLGGEKVTEAHLMSAEDLIREAQELTETN